MRLRFYWKISDDKRRYEIRRRCDDVLMAVSKRNHNESGIDFARATAEFCNAWNNANHGIVLWKRRMIKLHNKSPYCGLMSKNLREVMEEPYDRADREEQARKQELSRASAAKGYGNGKFSTYKQNIRKMPKKEEVAPTLYDDEVRPNEYSFDDVMDLGDE